MNKKKAYNLLHRLNQWLTENLPRKEQVINEVKNRTPAGGEAEGVFISQFLYLGLKSFIDDYFKNLRSEDYEKRADQALVLEGIKPSTQHRHSFFGSKLAPDLYLKPPFPFTIVGEVKYSRYPRDLQILVGQMLIYLRSSEAEEQHCDYAYGLFYDISPAEIIKKASRNPLEQKLLQELWNKFGIFIGIT